MERKCCDSALGKLYKHHVEWDVSEERTMWPLLFANKACPHKTLHMPLVTVLLLLYLITRMRVYMEA